MNISTIRLCGILAGTLLLGALIGSFSVFLTTTNARLKPVKKVEALMGTNAEFLNDSFGAKIGSFAVYHSPGKNEALSIVASQDSYPVIFIQKFGLNHVEVSISDKKQNILSGIFKNEMFETTSYLNTGHDDLKVSNIDMNADGIYDLIAKQTKNNTEAKFFYEGQWYPYKLENGKRLIETSDGWREIVKSSTGFRFR